jgi:hypothetical protein
MIVSLRAGNAALEGSDTLTVGVSTPVSGTVTVYRSAFTCARASSPVEEMRMMDATFGFVCAGRVLPVTRRCSRSSEPSQRIESRRPLLFR